MNNMKSFTSIVGWLLLVTLIAVPSFLFYNWWANTKNNEAASVTQPESLPPGSIFPGSDKAGAARQPDSEPAQPQSRSWVQPPGTAAAQPPSSPAAQPPSRPAAQPSSRPAVQPPSRPAAQQPGTQAVRQSSSPATRPPGTPATQVAVSTRSKLVSYFNPETDRDPTMTPDDYQKIRDEEQRRREEERLARLAALRKKHVDGPETWLKLQGIVGNRIIINGEMYSVGMSVKGVKILKIGSDYIIGEYRVKGALKKFKKAMQ